MTMHEMNQWAEHTLISLGLTLQSNLPEIIQQTPWSHVLRFVTSQGVVYLKQTPKALALEAEIIQSLREHCHASVPEIIACNAKLHCFLMKDAGKSLRTLLKQQFDERLMCKAIEQFTSLQIRVADHIDILFNIGVPDWRLKHFPNLYRQLLSKKEVLLSDGLSELEISQLESYLPQLIHYCETLSEFALTETLVQPDFNDNNTVVDEKTQKMTIIDLGEIAISHPFFSLLNCLQQMTKHYGLTEKDTSYLRIKEACLKNFMSFGSNKDLLSALKIASILFPIYSALAHHRLLLACDHTKFVEDFKKQGRVGVPLKTFLISCRGHFNE